MKISPRSSKACVYLRSERFYKLTNLIVKKSVCYLYRIIGVAVVADFRHEISMRHRDAVPKMHKEQGHNYLLLFIMFLNVIVFHLSQMQ